jgi:hypothetical protein
LPAARRKLTSLFSVIASQLLLPEDKEDADPTGEGAAAVCWFPNLQRVGSSVAHPVSRRRVLVILAGLLAFRALFYPLILVLTCQLLCVGLLFARFSNLAIGLRTFGR